MDGHEVGDLQQLLHGHALGLLLVKDIRGQIGVVSHNVHLEGVSQLAHALSHTAKAQDTQGLAPQLAAHELILVPSLVHLHVDAGGDGVAGDLQHLGDGQLGHSVVVQAGGVKDLDVLGLGGIHVDVVQAHGANADDLQVGSGVQDILVDSRIYPHDEHVIVSDDGSQLLLGGEHFGVHLHVLAQFLLDRAVDGVDDETFHSESSFLL